MAEDVVNIATGQPGTQPTVGIKAFSMVDPQGRLVEAQAVIVVDELGRPYRPMSEDTGQRLATAIETLANLIADGNGALRPF